MFYKFYYFIESYVIQYRDEDLLILPFLLFRVHDRSQFIVPVLLNLLYILNTLLFYYWKLSSTILIQLLYTTSLSFITIFSEAYSLTNHN